MHHTHAQLDYQQALVVKLVAAMSGEGKGSGGKDPGKDRVKVSFVNF